MNTTLSGIKKVVSGSNLVFIIDDISQLKKTFLSTGEQSFSIKEIQKENYVTAFLHNQQHIFITYFDKKLKTYKADEKCRVLGSQVAFRANKHGITDFTIVNLSSLSNAALSLAEGSMLSNYQFLKYKKEAKKLTNSLKKIYIADTKIDTKEIQKINIVTEANFITKDLVNEPLSYLTAVQFGKEMQKLGKASGFKTEILDKRKIQSLKMGGLLAVNRGSQDPPIFAIMEWKPTKAKNKKPIVLVGKGVVYDTGGLSLKPTPNSMDKMKCDMAGGAAVVGTMYAIAKAKLPIHVIGLVPATDNRPGENAYTPGDVITMHNGVTVEVLNTDAEGRLILADALSYAKKYNPELVFDLATLTGASARAIGQYGTVYMGTADDTVKKELEKSGENTYERLVEFPFWEEYEKLIESDVADIKNVGGAVGGSITAGKFLQKFVSYPWLHFDIAGSAFIDKADGYRSKNATGVGVRLLFNYLMRR